MVGLGRSGFGKEDPPLDPLESGWDGRDPQSTARWSGWVVDGLGPVGLARWVGFAIWLDRPNLGY